MTEMSSIDLKFCTGVVRNNVNNMELKKFKMVHNILLTSAFFLIFGLNINIPLKKDNFC